MDTYEKKIREYLNNSEVDELYKNMLLNLFPELAESEDEKVRNHIRRAISVALDYSYFDKETADNCLSWLEKQKEPLDKGEISDGCHTFNELYYYRMLYNAAFFNLLPKEWVHKSKKHHTGEECFGGGWFIVMAELPTGQISNHYEMKDWDLFDIPEKDVADEWDGHTPQEAAERLHNYLLEKQKAIDILDEEEREFADNVDSYRKEIDAAYQKGYNEGVKVTLEKQGEQKPNPCDGCINRKGCINCENGELREAEQKPEENKGNVGGISSNSAWSEEEERYICQLESMVKERWALAEKALDEEVIKNMSNLAFFLKTLNPNKKPSDEEMKTILRSEYEKGRADAIAEMQGEWSEEDIIHLNNCISYMSRLDSSEMDWLKSLKGRVQPKQEWNEEDEKEYKYVLKFVDNILNNCGNKKDYEHCKRCYDWLKSLRPQNNWKPSDEQIEALDFAANCIVPTEFCVKRKVLKELLEQLKKLKEGKV